MCALTERQRRTICGRARTLQERLENPPATNGNTDAQVSLEDFFQNWQENVAEDDPDRFQKRFAFEEIDQNDCGTKLRHHWPADEALPEWIHDLETILEVAATQNPQTPGDWTDDEVPFVELLEPFIEHARETITVERPDIVTDAAVDDLIEFYADRLARLLSHPLFVEFKTFIASDDPDLVFDDDVEIPADSTEYYDEFVSEMRNGGLTDFFLEYSFSARLVTNWTTDWADRVESLYTRLEADHSELCDTFDVTSDDHVTELAAVGDAHQAGRAVLEVGFESGETVAYKPRNMGMVVGFFDLLEWVNERSDLPDLRTVDGIYRADYAWMEWVTPEPCESTNDVSTYYRRAGMLLCVFFAMDATDLHLENVVAEGSQPVFIDLETVTQPLVKPKNRVMNEAVRAANETVIRTGILPRYLPASNVNHAAGFGGKQMEFEVEDRQFVDVNTDRMEMITETRPPKAGVSLPEHDGEHVSPDEHADAIHRGFSEMYQFVMDNETALLASDGPIENLGARDARVRALYRNTGVYTSILANARAPSYQRTGLDFGLQVEKLAKLFITEQTGDDVWPIFECEASILKNYNTPRFTAKADTTHIYDRDEVIVEEFFEERPIDQIRDRIAGFDEDDLAEQLTYIEWAYGDGEREHVTESATDRADVTDADLDVTTMAESLATDIYERTRASATSTDETPTWVHRKADPEHGLYLRTIDEQLYDGRVGVGVFAAALARVTGEDTHRAFAVDTVEPILDELEAETFENEPDRLREPPRPIGAGAGLGSIVYGLTTMGALLSADRFVDAARDVSELITADRIEADTQYDVLHGSAGAILGLLALHEQAGDEDVLDRARTAGEHLLSNAVETDTGLTWHSASFDQPLCGFGHGVAGISYALSRLGESTGDERFTNAALDAIASENEQYDAARENWPDRRAQTNGWMDAWCHGRTGIGLSRLGTSRAIDDPTIERDVDRALDGVNQPAMTAQDHLCCGNFGTVEFLLAAADVRNDDTCRRHAERLAITSGLRAKTDGRFRTQWQTDHWHNPGLFTGETGIGYALLRFVDPSLPCLLLFE